MMAILYITIKNTPKIEGARKIVSKKLAEKFTTCIKNVLEVSAIIPRTDFCLIVAISTSCMIKIQIFP